MKPFLLTSAQAAAMPRVLLWSVCLLYIIPGLVGRDPWRMADAEGFGIAYTMAMAERGALDWLLPNIVGMPIASDGPLPYWLGALAMRAMPWVEADAAFQLLAMLWLAGTLLSVWLSTFLLARRPGLMPSDPLGASASRIDFARAVADCALLIAVATFGLLARSHETTGDAAQLAWVGLFLLGCAVALERPRLGGMLAGVAIGCTLLSRGLPLALALSAVAVLVSGLSAALRWVARPFLVVMAVMAVLVAAPWFFLLIRFDAGIVHLQEWLAWNAEQIRGPSAETWWYALRTTPWFFWPAWPLALWTVWRWHGRGRDPGLALPGLSALALSLLALAAPQGAETHWLPVTLPVAILAALGLLTVSRAVTSLIDWFALMTFSTLGFVLWAYWIALQTGWPPRMAFRIRESVGGFEPAIEPLALLAGGLATLSWLMLVAWRISRSSRTIWRSVLLSSGGMVLTWTLLMTLWLPAGNHRKTYREPAQQAGALVAKHPGCVIAVALDGAQRASFAYLGGLRFDARDPQTCRWLLVADHARAPFDTEPLLPRWQQVWRGQRPADRREQFLLFERIED